MTANTKLVFTVEEACQTACCGKTALYEAIKSGKLIARKRGRKTLITDQDLKQWIESLPAIAPKSPDKTKKMFLRNTDQSHENNFVSST